MRRVAFINRYILGILAFAVMHSGCKSTFAQTAVYNERYTIQGFSQPIRHAALSGSTYGIVKSRDVDEGQWVRQGDCLVQLDHRVHDGKLELARVAKESLGEVQIAEAELEASQSRYDRLAELARKKHATDVELLQASEALNVARASVRRAKDRLAQLVADHQRLVAELDQYFIRAPFPGVVVEFNKQVGEYVGPGESIVCTLADLSALSVEFLVPRACRATLSDGQEVSVLFTVSKHVATGAITYISPFPNGETNTYKVKVRVDNSDGDLSAGERCLLQDAIDAPPKTSDSTRDQLTQRVP